MSSSLPARRSLLETPPGAAAEHSPRPELAAMLLRARYEIIPLGGVADQLGHLPAGATVAVTCSPTRGLTPTVELAQRAARLGFHAVPHLAARQVESERHLLDIVSALEECGISEVFVVGGDVERPSGPFRDSLALLMALHANGVALEAGVAAYPEGHPRISQHALLEDLIKKQRYARYMVTQLCFDAGAILKWLAAVRRNGIELNAYVGVPGPIGMPRLLSVAAKIGIGDSMKFLASNAGQALRLLGGYQPGDLIEELHRGSEPTNRMAGFHLFTFNQLAKTEAWVRDAVSASFRASAGPTGAP